MWTQLTMCCSREIQFTRTICAGLGSENFRAEACATYFKGFAAEATAIEETCKAETFTTTFGTHTSNLPQGDCAKLS